MAKYRGFSSVFRVAWVYKLPIWFVYLGWSGNWDCLLTNAFIYVLAWLSRYQKLYMVPVWILLVRSVILCF